MSDRCHPETVVIGAVDNLAIGCPKRKELEEKLQAKKVAFRDLVNVADKLEDQLSKLKVDLAYKDAALLETMRNWDQSGNALDAARGENLKLKDRIEGIRVDHKKELKEKDKKIEGLTKSSIANFDKSINVIFENARLKEKLAFAEARLKETPAQSSREMMLQSEVNKLKEDLRISEANLEHAHKRIVEVCKEVEKYKEKLERKRDDIADIRKDFDEVCEQRDMLSKSHGELAVELDRVRKERSDFLTEMHQAKAGLQWSLDRALEGNDKLAADVEKLKKEVAYLRAY